MNLQRHLMKPVPQFAKPKWIVAFGGSAGAIPPLIEILSLLPSAFQIPILVVQHLPNNGPGSVLPMVLGWRTSLCVKWAQHGEDPVGGTAYVAPSDYHLTVAPDGSLELSTSPRVNRVRPSADPLFESIARVFGNRAVAVVLSGMMADGARGIAAVRKAGGVTIAQDEATSLYFDMPCAAIDLGGSQISFEPRKIAQALCAIGS